MMRGSRKPLSSTPSARAEDITLFSIEEKLRTILSQMSIIMSLRFYEIKNNQNGYEQSLEHVHADISDTKQRLDLHHYG